MIGVGNYQRHINADIKHAPPLESVRIQSTALFSDPSAIPVGPPSPELKKVLINGKFVKEKQIKKPITINLPKILFQTAPSPNENKSIKGK